MCIVNFAEKEIGYKEYPADSNKTKYGKWFGLDGQPWCAMFVSWIYNKAGIEMPKIGFTKPGYAGCQSAYAYFKKHNMITNTPKAGDIVLFDWNNDGRYDHTGIFVKRLTSTTFETIEGNTSLTNQSNGGEVMRRTRKYSQSIFATIK
jgi:cell wall-associated NlpC family hydrolase